MQRTETEFTPQFIIDTLAEDFALVYKPFTRYLNPENEIWKKCVGVLNDIKAMNRMIFCNDKLFIPPVRVFLALNPDILESDGLNSYDKQFIGCFFAFVFKEVFGYQKQTKTCINSPCIKTALYFTESREAVRMVAEADKPKNAPKKGE